jgi:glutamate synthase (NADPH/NADH) small chain
LGDNRGFLSLRRAEPARRPVGERTRDWREMYAPLPEDSLRAQGARCMDCGVPFCQGDTGCPVRNAIPDWNDLVYRGRWRDALASLHATNNFPEFTGRLCPAPCESACVLGLIDRPVAIRTLEQAIVDRGFDEGWVVPRPPHRASGHSVAVVGSGPAGLAAAQQLRRAGHSVVVFERSDRVGGLLRYGIPDFKMEKAVLDRRVEQLEAEGVTFRTGIAVGTDISAAELRDAFDAVLLATGSTTPRTLGVPGADLGGVHLAMDFLTQQNHVGAGDVVDADARVSAAGKRVVIIGGGDTGSDCLGTCHRQGAREVWQFELLPEPPRERAASTPWPLWPMQLRTSHAHEEGGRREWNVSTREFTGRHGRLERLHAARVEQGTGRDGAPAFVEIPGTHFALDVDLVLLALGFTGPERQLADTFGISMTPRKTFATGPDYATAVEGVFAAGDARRGASLIVWAIREGRDAAAAIHTYLQARASAAANKSSALAVPSGFP